MRTVAIVPARGGSKGLPRKNLRLLAGLPLIVYSIRAGLEAALVDATYVSTENEEIARVAEDHGARVIRRPPELATDTAQNDAVVCHALETLRAAGHDPELVVLLQPTSPLRGAAHVDDCLRQYRDSGAASAMSVCPVEHHPARTVLLRGGLIEPFAAGWDMEARRQNLPPVFRQNGAICVARVSDMLEHGRFFRRPSFGYIMERRDSIDIDDALDLRSAEAILGDTELAP